METLVETSSPRGRIALIKGVSEGRLDLTSPGFMHQMSECLDCRACEAVCPSGVAYGQLLEPARTQVQRATESSQSWQVKLIRSFLLDRVFGNMGLLRIRSPRFDAALAAPRIGRAFARSDRASCARSGLDDAERLAPRMSDRFFTPADQRWPAEGKRKATAFIHAGCVMHVAFAHVDEATVRVLQKAGCDVVAPRGQGCCGALNVHAGEMDRGRELAKRNIASFEKSGADVYVVNAAGCGSALKEYGHLFNDDPEWEDRATAFSSRVRDITEWLDEVGISPELGPVERTVTYQEPCHLVHAQRISAAPRRLLARIPGLVLREMPESSICCGSAGIYNLTQPEMAERLQARKVANVLKVEPDVVATANPGCALQVAGGLRAAGREIPVRHVVELLDEAYANYAPAKPGL